LFAMQYPPVRMVVLAGLFMKYQKHCPLIRRVPPAGHQ
jgi:hypothetical protein